MATTTWRIRAEIAAVIVEDSPADRQVLADRVRRHLCPGDAVLHDAELRDRRRAGVGLASEVRALRRGAVNIPTPTTIADITTAISTISRGQRRVGRHVRDEDVSGPDVSCVHGDGGEHLRPLPRVREPEREDVAGEDRPRERVHDGGAGTDRSRDFMLDRIKALSINVTNGATTLSSMIYLVEAIVRAAFGITRTAPDARRLTVPGASCRPGCPTSSRWTPSRRRSTGSSRRSRWWTTCAAWASTRCSTSTRRRRARRSCLTPHRPPRRSTRLPANIQWAIHPESAFLGIDAGSLELGIVRDSTLNATNDFQVFGERFRNLVLIGPAQSAYWVTTTYCAGGQFPPAGTSRSCPTKQ